LHRGEFIIELKLRHDVRGEVSQGSNLNWCQIVRGAVEGHQGTDNQIILGDKWEACVKGKPEWLGVKETVPIVRFISDVRDE
jgi:hypothetical protein